MHHRLLVRRLVPAALCGLALCASSSAQTTLYTKNGDKANDRLGTICRAAGDVNNDGRPDFIAGATEEAIFGNGGEGYARVYSGATGGTLYTINGAKIDERFGFAVDGCGDTNNDSYDDFVVGGYNAGTGATTFGRAVVYSGATGAVRWTFNGDADGDKLGYAVAGAGDVNNDGYADIIVGAPYAPGGGSSRGYARVFNGQTGGVIRTINGTADNALSGFVVDGVGDVNNDGYDDVIVGSPNSGARVYSGQNGGLLRTYTGPMNDRLGIAVAGLGDITGDMIPDIIVGATQDGNIFNAGNGYANVYNGAGPGAVLVRSLPGDGVGDRFGFAVGGAGDLNADDLVETIVGADQQVGGGNGYARVANGMDGSPVHTIIGTNDTDRFGASVDGLGDCNGDGSGEFIVASPPQSSTFTLGGQVKVFSSTMSRSEPGVAYCFGDNIDPSVTTDCPCGNFGGAGRGCANSNSALHGARVTATGAVSPNTINFMCDGVPNGTLCVFLRGTTNTAAGIVFGDGVECVGGTIVRFGQQNAGQGGNPANTAASGTASVAAGNTRFYQCHYRNPNTVFCTPELFNISSGYQVAW